MHANKRTGYDKTVRNPRPRTLKRKNREIGRLDGEGLVDRADDVPGDCSEHRGFPLFPTVNAFGGPSEGSPTWVNFTKVACLDGPSKRKTDALVYVGAAVIPTPSSPEPCGLMWDRRPRGATHGGELSAGPRRRDPSDGEI